MPYGMRPSFGLEPITGLTTSAVITARRFGWLHAMKSALDLPRGHSFTSSLNDMPFETLTFTPWLRRWAVTASARRLDRPRLYSKEPIGSVWPITFTTSLPGVDLIFDASSSSATTPSGFSTALSNAKRTSLLSVAVIFSTFGAGGRHSGGPLIWLMPPCACQHSL